PAMSENHGSVCVDACETGVASRGARKWAGGYTWKHVRSWATARGNWPTVQRRERRQVGALNPATRDDPPRRALGLQPKRARNRRVGLREVVEPCPLRDRGDL